MYVYLFQHDISVNNRSIYVPLNFAGHQINSGRFKFCNENQKTYKGCIVTGEKWKYLPLVYIVQHQKILHTTNHYSYQVLHRNEIHKLIVLFVHDCFHLKRVFTKISYLTLGEDLYKITSFIRMIHRKTTTEREPKFV